MSETRFLLIRHAESTWNATGRWQGHADLPLSARGRVQAEALGVELAGHGIEVLLTSDLARAAQTAAILGKALGLEPTRDACLRELDIGCWSGFTRAEIAEREPEALARFESGDPDVRVGGGESRRQLRSRVRRFVQEQSRQHAGRLVAIVAHMGALRALRPGLLLANTGWCLMSAGEIGKPAPGGTAAAGG
jgi:broad specificity phosphatase PhoE